MGDLPRAVIVATAIAAATGALLGLGVENAATVALCFLLIVLIVAATSRLWLAIAASFVSMLCVNYFFLPPVGTLTIADPTNWVALIAFLAVSVVASNLSSTVRTREREALERRDEMARLFDLSRDVLLMTDGRDAMTGLAVLMARRFGLDYVAICLPSGADWKISESGRRPQPLDPAELTAAFEGVAHTLEFDASERTYAGHRTVRAGDDALRLIPLRAASRPIGLLVAGGRAVDPGTLDALGGLAAIAIERAQFLEERKTAELARQGEALKSALLASLGHDLRTPLTAIRVAASNLQASWLTPEERNEQSTLVLTEVERLTRLFQNILDMTRIDAGAVSAATQWVHAAEIIEAARDLVAQALISHPLEIRNATDRLMKVDPRLTATALSHVLENAAQYSPEGQPIQVEATLEGGTVLLQVRDHGRGVRPADLPHLFERFYRGAEAKHRTAGTGMGLAIARGLLAVEQGRIWGENHPDGGARFTIALSAPTRPAEAGEGG